MSHTFANLPSDIANALAQYDADIASGAITFDATGFAATYPGQAKTDASLSAYVASKIAE